MRTAPFATGLLLAIWYITAPAHEGTLEPLGGGKYQLVYPDDPPPIPPTPPPASACPATDGAINWYVATNGNDANDGTCEHPFRHVSKAFDAARDPVREVQVWVEGGRYAQARVRNSESFPHGLTVQCWPGEDCVMDGEHSVDAFYWYSGSSGECQNVTFQSITVHQYIQYGFMLRDPKFRDERDRRDQNWNGCNTFRDITITRLGNDWGCSADFTGDCKGFGGIASQNSDDNLVDGLHCEDLRNSGKGSGIHCVYWSNGSDDNVVRDSTCKDITSSCWKLRDDSRKDKFINVTCKDSPLCFYSGMPNSRPEETRDRDVTITNMKVKGGDKWECRLKASGSGNADNCKKIVIGADSKEPDEEKDCDDVPKSCRFICNIGSDRDLEKCIRGKGGFKAIKAHEICIQGEIAA